MNDQSPPRLSRRELLKTSGQVAAAAALAGIAVPAVHAAEESAIRVALVGCGERGGGATVNALSTHGGPVKLVAMADVFDKRLQTCYKALKPRFNQQVDVPKDRQFIGFDAYKHAMDCLKPGDVVILATPPAFRWVHFSYAIEKGLNVFMEKPISVDGPSTRRMFKLGQESEKRNLKVAVGLMCRHCAARNELYKRISDGQIGDIMMLRTYRMSGPIAQQFVLPKPPNISELLYQIQNFHAFLWASGGCFSDFLIHFIDECCWMKNAWPVEAKASGGRHYRGQYIDQNFDNYAVEYTFDDGTKLYLDGRNMEGCYSESASYAHGTKGSAVISTSGHTPAKCRIYKDQKFSKDKLAWHYPSPEPSPYQLEWDLLLADIRADKPHNEVNRGAEASLITAMGRLAAHTGQVVTRDQMLQHDHDFAPLVDKLKMDSPAPLTLAANGKYPVPEPGINRTREF